LNANATDIIFNKVIIGKNIVLLKVLQQNRFFLIIIILLAINK